MVGSLSAESPNELGEPPHGRNGRSIESGGSMSSQEAILDSYPAGQHN